LFTFEIVFPIKNDSPFWGTSSEIHNLVNSITLSFSSTPQIPFLNGADAGVP
jgi:hypothetical protein